MKYLLLVLFIVFFKVGFTQKNEDFTGHYELNFNHSPQGEDAMLCVLKNNKFVIISIGGDKTGTWQMANDTLVEFKFKPAPSNPFSLYGRYNKDLGDSTRIFFQEFDRSGSFIHLGRLKTEKITMKRIFNKDANCVGFPNVYTIKNNAENISFTQEEYYTNVKQSPYTFYNDEKFNDFIATVYAEPLFTQSFYASIKKNGLYFLEEKYIAEKITSLDPKNEITKWAYDIVNSNPDPDTLYFSPDYTQVKTEEFKNYSYTYNQQKGAYILANYSSASNNDEFDDIKILYPFRAIRKFSIIKKDFAIDESPIFNFKCE